MNQETRSIWADYIAEGLRFAEKETNLTWPEETIIITKPWCELAEINEILDMKVFVIDTDSAYDLAVAFKAKNEKEYKLLGAFKEYMQLTTIEIGE